MAGENWETPQVPRVPRVRQEENTIAPTPQPYKPPREPRPVDIDDQINRPRRPARPIEPPILPAPPETPPPWPPGRLPREPILPIEPPIDPPNRRWPPPVWRPWRPPETDPPPYRGPTPDEKQAEERQRITEAQMLWARMPASKQEYIRTTMFPGREIDWLELWHALTNRPVPLGRRMTLLDALSGFTPTSPWLLRTMGGGNPFRGG